MSERGQIQNAKVNVMVRVRMPAKSAKPLLQRDFSVLPDVALKVGALIFNDRHLHYNHMCVYESTERSAMLTVVTATASMVYGKIALSIAYTVPLLCERKRAIDTVRHRF